MRALKQNGLSLFFLGLFAVTLAGHTVAGHAEVNDHATNGHTIAWPEYLGKGEFWSTTLQNWQSEFLAVGAMVILSVFLRQRGSPQSRLVGAPHVATAEEG